MQIALTASLNSLPVIFAYEKGIFRDYGLDVQISLYTSFLEIEKRLELKLENCGEVNFTSFLKRSLISETPLSFYPVAPLSYTQCKFYSNNPVFASTNFEFCKNHSYFTILPLEYSIQSYIFKKISERLNLKNLSVDINIVSLNLAEKFFYFRECLGIAGDPLIYPFLYDVKNIFQMYEDSWFPNTVLCFNIEQIQNSSFKIRAFLQALQDSISLLRNTTQKDIFHNTLNFFTKFSTHLSIKEIQTSSYYAKKFIDNIFPLNFTGDKENVFIELISGNETNSFRLKEFLNKIKKNIQFLKLAKPLELEFEGQVSSYNKIRYQKIDAEMYKVLFRESIEIMLIISEDFNILDVNNKFLAETGFNFNEVININLSNLFSKGKDFELIKNGLFNNNENFHFPSLALVCKNGALLNVDVYVSIFRRHDHKDFLLTVINNAERKEILRLKNQFISNISHELRTPMTNIQGYFEMLLQEPQIKLSQEARNNLEAIDRNIKKMNRLVENLLQLGRSKLEVQPQLIEVFEAHTVIEEVIYLNEALARDKKLEIRKILHVGIFIKGNKFEFSQVITNLIVNAIKYTDEGYILVSCKKNEEGMCEIKVKDTGIGIDSKYHSSIFESFFRVPDLQNRKIGGTGIGLAITKEIIQKMNGTIKLESEVGKGSEFKITLPIVSYG